MVATLNKQVQINGLISYELKGELQYQAKESGMKQKEFIGEIVSKYLQGELVEKGKLDSELSQELRFQFNEENKQMIQEVVGEVMDNKFKNLKLTLQ